MQCPYCRSDILDEVLVCKHCRRDVAFLRPFLAEIAELRSVVQAHEEAIQTIATELSNLTRTTPTLQGNKRLLRVPSLRAWILVAIGVSLDVALYALGRSDLLPFNTSIILMTIAPFPLGVWYGRVMPGRHFRRYVAVGIIIALLGLLGTLVYFWITAGFIGTFSAKDFQYMAILIIGPTLIFTVGAFFGDWLEDVARGRSSPGTAIRLADLLVRHNAYPAPKARADRVAQIAAIIAALGPVLTFIATLATGYLTYLAAAHKVKDDNDITSSARSNTEARNTTESVEP